MSALFKVYIISCFVSERQRKGPHALLKKAYATHKRENRKLEGNKGINQTCCDCGYIIDLIRELMNALSRLTQQSQESKGRVREERKEKRWETRESMHTERTQLNITETSAAREK